MGRGQGEGQIQDKEEVPCLVFPTHEWGKDKVKEEVPCLVLPTHEWGKDRVKDKYKIRKRFLVLYFLPMSRARTG